MSGARLTIDGLTEVRRTIRSVADLDGIIEDRCAGAIQEVMRADAVANLTESKAVNTGALRNSVKTEEGITERTSVGVSVGIRTSIPYAMFIEYGTGPRGDPAVPHTSRMSWVYPTRDGSRFRVAVSQPARPFMRPALYDNRKAFLEIIRNGIEEVYES